MTKPHKTKQNTIKITIITILSLVLLSLAIVTPGLIQQSQSNLRVSRAAGPNTVDIILGQKTVGNSIEASVCLLADTAINLGDTGIWLKYDNTKLTPNQTLTSKGIYDGPADLSGSFAPMTWNLVSGRNDTFEMRAIFNSNPAIPIPNSTSATNNTSRLFASATFAVGSGGSSTNITIDQSGTAVLKRPTNTPLTLTIINFAGDCTAYRSGGVVQTPTLGTAPSTPIIGTVGSALPTITLTGSNLAANTPATFTPAGGTSITGTITNGVFTPTAPATISANTITGNAIGLLAVTTPTGVAPLNISTSFSVAVVTTPTLGTAPTVAITGTIGSYLPDIQLTGSNIASGTAATFTPAGGTAIPGTIQNGYFRSSTFIPQKVISPNSTTGNAIGVLSVTTPTGVTPLNIPTNFSAAAVTNPVVGTVTATAVNPITGVIGSSFGTIMLNGNTYADNTPDSFIPEGTTVAITGRILGGNFVAFANQPIPSGTLTGNRMGVLKINGINLNVPTNFSAAAVPPPATQPGSGAVITITNNSSSSISSTTSSSSETKSETTTPPPVQANIDSSGDDTIVLPKTGGVRKGTVQLESESLPRTGGNNQIILAILSIVSAVTFFAVYQSVHKRKILNFDKETKVK